MTEETLTLTLQAHSAVEHFQHSDAFKVLIEPLKEELAALKSAYDCTTLEELAHLKGKRDGLRFILDRMEQLLSAGERAKEQTDKDAKRAARENQEINSTDL